MNQMKRIAVDMDGVLADTYPHFLKYEAEYSGISKNIEDVMGVPEFEAFPHSSAYLLRPGFFRTVPVVPGSIHALQQINAHHEVFIVSAATEFPPSLSEKQQWLNEHFPFISWKQMVFCGSKTIISADIMIDDHFKNLDLFPGKTYLYNQPHNAYAQPGRHQRVHNWEELAGILLKTA